MFKKGLYILTIMMTSQAFASDKGIHITFDINSDQGDRAALGTTDYYFQDGNFRIEANMQQGAVDNVTMIEKKGTLYTLFPKDKTYMEVPGIIADAAANLIKDEDSGTFKPTGEKKKIAGYDCEVLKKENVNSVDTVCVNQPLYDAYKDFFIKMKKMSKGQNSFADVQGFPLEAISIGKGKEKTKTTLLVKNIEQQNFTSKFVLPKDYKKKDSLKGAAELMKKIANEGK